ncbi:glutathione peroxidase [Ectothiorhodospira lacustris]|uniref:glutathione peroxidase n=1 Tax=Ectothiorhodospira lacustris TaxID=2899127 RepID=UPI001EE83653|nr:glutathione peroxidase [Ectothiorhodospira lacustris]MCG5500031.1 glutathione peroxidase [Ectothiorhodospira lacustris]MCG5508640.1 glutathione peroxidase [Ectothiorhodospira lacustris]MCG5520431.1 glutathione peroxidase [Ectothiorhodospira lacustris]
MRRCLLTALLITLPWSPGLIAREAPGHGDLFDHDLRRLHSSEVVNLRERFAGHPLLIVNTASHCGFTGQFSALEAVHRKYADQGLKVVGFPSNDFRQEADDEADTARVCFQNFGVSFDMFAPISVRGDTAHPIFQELARQSRAPRWNFYKYLVDREGQVVATFSSMVSPDSRRFEAAVERLLRD